MYILQVVFALLSVISVIFLWVSMIALRLTLDRRVRRAMPSDKIYDNYPDWYFGIGRAIVFGAASIFEYPKKSPVMIVFYDSFDVKNFANSYEKTIAWTMIVSLITMFVASGLYYCFDELGWFSPLVK